MITTARTTSAVTCLNKRRFLSETDAVMFHRHGVKAHPETTPPQRAYKCNHCYFWHLTSKEAAS